MPPWVLPNTPRLKFQFRHLDRTMRRVALQTIFDELEAHNLSDRREIIRRIEQIVFLFRQHPKTQYKTTPSVKERATWVRAVNRLSRELEALLRDCPYGENYLSVCHGLPNIMDDLERLTKGHNAKAGKKRKSGGRPREGFDWLVAPLANFYSERTGRPAGRSTNAENEPSGPFHRVIRAVCDLIGIQKTEKTDCAIDKTIARLPDKTLGDPQ